MPTPPPADPAIAHRWFAVQCNNRAWTLVEQADRSPSDTAEMLDTAHAANWHWQEVGEPIHRLRARHLVAMANWRAGLVERARCEIETVLTMLDHIDGDSTAIDRAIIHGAAAGIFRSAGHGSCAADHQRQFERAQAALTDADEIQLLKTLRFES